MKSWKSLWQIVFLSCSWDYNIILYFYNANKATIFLNFFNLSFSLCVSSRGHYNESTVSGWLKLWNSVTMCESSEFESLLRLK